MVDGGSGDGSAAELGEALARPDYAGWIEFLPLPINGGFGWANNRGIQRLMRSVEPPRYIHALNPDTEVEADAVAYLAQYLDQHPRVAAVGSQLLSMDGSRVGGAFSFPSIRGEFARAAATRALERLFHIPPISIETDEAAEVDWVTGGSVMLRVEALRQVGLFDEGFFLYNEEVELMWRLRKAGWSVAVEPRSRVRHVGGGATGISEREAPEKIQPRKPAYMFRSRARYFGLTRGRSAALAAYAAWLAGHAVWRARRLLGVPIGKPIDHQTRDHLAKAFPRAHDVQPAIVSLQDEGIGAPAWMDRHWL